MSKWYGEVRNYTPSELSHLLRQYHKCRSRERRGEIGCGEGFDEWRCSDCPYHSSILLIKKLDPLTRSKLEEKEEFLYAEELRGKRRRTKNSICSAMQLLVISLGFLIVIVVLSGGK